MVPSWETVGKCDVDSGLILLIDPYHVVPPHLWKTFLDKFRRNQVGHAVNTGLATVIQTEQGNGVYPVEARYNNSGQIVEVRIKFD